MTFPLALLLLVSQNEHQRLRLHRLGQSSFSEAEIYRILRIKELQDIRANPAELTTNAFNFPSYFL